MLPPADYFISGPVHTRMQCGNPTFRRVSHTAFKTHCSCDLQWVYSNAGRKHSVCPHWISWYRSTMQCGCIEFLKVVHALLCHSHAVRFQTIFFFMGWNRTAQESHRNAQRVPVQFPVWTLSGLVDLTGAMLCNTEMVQPFWNILLLNIVTCQKLSQVYLSNYWLVHFKWQISQIS